MSCIGDGMTKHVVKLRGKIIGGKAPFLLIAGPCVIESQNHALAMASKLKKICRDLHVPFVFKSSYDKANRTSVESFRGPGLEEGLKTLSLVKEKIDVPVCSDVHTEEEARRAGEVLDILQIPALLCRQTDLLLAAGRTGKIVNIKKGQFLAPWDMGPAVRKVLSTKNHNILLTERGVSFGYNNLVSDMRSLVIMSDSGFPVIYDATHSVQLPGGAQDRSSGERRFIPYLARAAMSCGIAGIFMEVHDRPDHARCDGPNMISLKELSSLLKDLKKIDVLVKK